MPADKTEVARAGNAEAEAQRNSKPQATVEPSEAAVASKVKGLADSHGVVPGSGQSAY